jgi:spore germination protein YaaH
MTALKKNNCGRSAGLIFLSITALLLVTFSSLFLPTTDFAQADNPPRKILTGWIPYYGMKTALPSAVQNSDLMRDVSPFWYTVTNENTITDLYTPANPSVPISVPIATLQSMNFTILPTITDGTNKGVLAGLIAKDSSRANLVRALVNLATTKSNNGVDNYHGVDLDFENFAFVDGNTTWPTTAVNWVKFITDLSTALHLQGKLLSVTTPVAFDPASGKKGYYVYDWPDIGPLIDRLRIMSYDYSTTTPGPIGPINWTEDAVKWAITAMPASKVFVGIPGYGRDWVTKVDGICPADVAAVVKTNVKAATFVMRDATNLASTYGATPIFNSTYSENTFTYQKTYNGNTSAGLATTCTATRTVWYQDPKSFADRAALVAKYRLGGLAQWTLGMEDPLATNSIRNLAKTIAPDAVVASVSTDVTDVNLGASVRITGTLKLPDGRALTGIPARIEVKNQLGDWHQVYFGITGLDGSISTKLILGSNSQLRITSDASWERLAGLSASTPLNVHRLISWRTPTSMKAGASYLITGQIQPKEGSVPVSILVNGVSDPASDTVTATDGNFSFTLRPTLPGIIKLQISTPADPSFVATTTDSFSVLVR